MVRTTTRGERKFKQGAGKKQLSVKTFQNGNQKAGKSNQKRGKNILKLENLYRKRGRCV